MPAPKVTPIQAFTLGADAAYLSKRPLPVAPDGHYDWQTSANANLSPEGHSGITNIISQVEAVKAKGAVNPDPHIIGAFLDTAINPDSVDDRQGAFSAGLTLLSRLPPDSEAAAKMSNAAIDLLYNGVPHPPDAYMGPEHCFRRADGGGNNIQDPDRGRAGTPYARSVQGKWCTDMTALPDPGLVFDTILKARDHKAHAGGNASLTFAFASLVTHSLFRTDFKNWNINNVSSYLDLSPLYGINQEAQDRVRDKAAGRGLMYPDTFSEERLLFLPPAASALLVILCRNHNYIAETILKINERGRWSDPPPTDGRLRAQQDEELFQTARLINGGHFMSLIMGDYVSGFLGLSEGNAWNMNAFDPIKTKEGLVVTRGQGNHCSVEFNVLYRWHATTSQADEKWTEAVFDKIFQNKPFNQLTMQDFGAAFRRILADINPDPSKRTFAGLVRGPDGKFSDDDIANVLHNATENPAGAYRARGTPGVFRIIEILGIEQARQWGVCSMNEFRKHMGLKQFESFEEWNPDPEIAGAARRLYGHIDNLELYTGLQAESTMPLTGGLRFACGYTMTRAVLSDAIALVRGDRFATTSFTPANLTTWGFQDTMRDPHNGGCGGNLPKLLTRHLPRHYPFNSVYSCFPFFTPQKMKDSLTKQGLAERYTYDRPVATPIPKVLNTFTGIKYVFNDHHRFRTMYELNGLGSGYGFMLSFDDAERHDADKALALHALFPSKDSLDKYRDWYRDGIANKIKERSWKYDGVPGNYVDIVRDVINVISVHWAADRLCGIPLKTKDNPTGLYTEQEVYDMFATIYDVAFRGIGDNEHGFSLRWTAAQAGGVTQALVAKSILEVRPAAAPNPLTRLIANISNYIWPPSKKPYYPFLSKLAETGRSLNCLVATVVGLAVGSSVDYAQAASQVIEFYLRPEYEKERFRILQLVQSQDAGSTELLRGYVREGMRLNPQVPGLWRSVAVDAQVPQGGTLPPLNVKAGDRIWASFRNAHLNPADFPNPTEVNPRRPKDSYSLNGTGFHSCPGYAYAEQTITEIVRVVFSLKNVRRAEGNAGKLVGFSKVVLETENNVYIMPNGTLSAWPGSMHIVYDD